jgi:hypothetical protein
MPRRAEQSRGNGTDALIEQQQGAATGVLVDDAGPDHRKSTPHSSVVGISRPYTVCRSQGILRHPQKPQCVTYVSTVAARRHGTKIRISAKLVRRRSQVDTDLDAALER